ncbi:MAG: hypothetical protein LBT09_06310 [Planctomycetaceae bacterium]|jgi:hypothetical protein|nr:hypothetical protein [Planctomycetaceae bacterium]
MYRSILYFFIVFFVSGEIVFSQPVYVPLQKIKKGDYEKMFQIPKRYINDDINRLYKGLDWIIDAINDNKGDMRALLYYPYIEFCGRRTDEDFSGFWLEFWLGHNENIPDNVKRWKTYLTQIEVSARRDTLDYALELHLFEDHLTRIREHTHDDFFWVLENDDSDKTRIKREYQRRNMTNFLVDSYFDGDEYESAEPASEYLEAVERMKIEAAKPTFRNPPQRDFKKGPFFARKFNRIDIREPVSGNYAEVRDLVGRLNKYAKAVSEGNPGPIIETPGLKKHGVFFRYNVIFNFGKDYVTDVLTTIRPSNEPCGSFISFDKEGTILEYVEGDLAIDLTKNKFVIDGTGTEIEIHPNGFLASYHKYVKNRLFGRQIEWNNKGEVISDINAEVPKNRPDKPKKITKDVREGIPKTK